MAVLIKYRKLSVKPETTISYEICDEWTLRKLNALEQNRPTLCSHSHGRYV